MDRESSRLVGNTLRLSALACGITGALFLPIYPLAGVALCAVAVLDLGLFWLLKGRAPAFQAGADPGAGG